MEKFLLLLISIAVLSPLVTSNEISCEEDSNGLVTICKDSGVITSVRETGLIWHDDFEVELNNFSSIAPNALQGLKITRLTLNAADPRNCTPKLIDLSPELFAGLSTLKYLDLRCMNLTAKPNLFKHLTSLYDLLLDRVEIIGDPEGIFDSPYLSSLHIYGSTGSLGTISPSTFSKLNKRLEGITIHGGITSIEPKSFERFRNLDNLRLNSIHLTDLSSGMFDGLRNLGLLRLSGNNIARLRGNVFEELENLKILSLTGNGITEIEPEAFFGLNRLVELSLFNNQLENLPAGVFSNLKNLQRLHLMENKFKSVPVGLCHNLQNLKELDLSDNEIKIVPLDAFDGCVKFLTLYLARNKIYRIEPNAFRGLLLHGLNLEYNNISVLEPDTFSGVYITGKLSLDHNQIDVIEPQAFRNMTGHRKLTSIILNSLKIDEVDREKWGLDDSIQDVHINHRS